VDQDCPCHVSVVQDVHPLLLLLPMQVVLSPEDVYEPFSQGALLFTVSVNDDQA
jgi:hypothetical protein